MSPFRQSKSLRIAIAAMPHIQTLPDMSILYFNASNLSDAGRYYLLSSPQSTSFASYVPSKNASPRATHTRVSYKTLPVVLWCNLLKLLLDHYLLSILRPKHLQLPSHHIAE